MLQRIYTHTHTHTHIADMLWKEDSFQAVMLQQSVKQLITTDTYHTHPPQPSVPSQDPQVHPPPPPPLIPDQPLHRLHMPRHWCPVISPFLSSTPSVGHLASLFPPRENPKCWHRPESGTASCCGAKWSAWVSAYKVPGKPAYKSSIC